ncbi:MAG: hypothetical protein ACWA40_07235 [Planktomarina sp.]
MHILDISITSMRRSMDGKRVLGDVTFVVDATKKKSKHQVHITCDTPYSERIRADAVLIGDAIQQVRRLPDIRDGTDRLTFASGLRPLSRPAQGMDSLRQAG